MGQWIKKVFAYDGMFYQMFPSYSSSLRVKIIYLEKLESEHETASIKTMVKNSVNTKMRIFCYYWSKNTQASTNLQICQKMLNLMVWMGLCSLVFAWMMMKYAHRGVDWSILCFHGSFIDGFQLFGISGFYRDRVIW